MKKQNKKHAKKIRNLVVICTLCAIVLTVSTYAWFIGMKTVNVSSFDIDIATTEGLFLSMDGKDWSYKLDAFRTDISTSYSTNTNFWAPDGLIPMSTVGDMDSTVSRMKLYEKASLTTTKGGYRLLTSRVDNYNAAGDGTGHKQGKGYVVFDLFVKNLSGTEYYSTNEPKNEEAIYLTTNSQVLVGTDGIENTGIENSVRVAFTQIGRVKADTTAASTIQGITCTGDSTVTGICRNAQIWEPNDTKHVANAINWYNTSCRSRKVTVGSTSAASDVTDDNSYTTTDNCSVVANGTAYSTYAISRAINVADNVDVYDGEDYNGYKFNSVDYSIYNAATGAAKDAYKLVDFPYFTDTNRDEKGMNRKKFMTLAPNSITKLRVYVYIEGQDVDNYDFASLGAAVKINFGFTKERFTEEDVSYTGPSTDITPSTTPTSSTSSSSAGV